MPVVSQQQRRLMYAEVNDPGSTDVPIKVAKDFIEASHGIKGLPKRVKRKHAVKSLRGGK